MMMKLKSPARLIAALSLAVFTISGCSWLPSWMPGSTATPKATVLNDGELKMPADYKSWPVFLANVQRPDAKQIRDIYMNPTARTGTASGGFPNGSVFVMENYAVQLNADGSVKLDANGKLMKDKLVAVFVQGKGEGWGNLSLPELKNGNWVYSAYMPDGSKHAQDTKTCRACHLPLAGKDFVHRYDEYFATRKTSSLKPEAVFASLYSNEPLSTQQVAQVAAFAK